MSRPESHVHDEIRHNLESIGWKALPEFREGDTLGEFIARNVFVEKLFELNRELFSELDRKGRDRLIECVWNYIKSAGVKEVLQALREGVICSVSGRAGKRSRRVRLMDFENPGANAFHYGHEAQFPGSTKDSRPDFTLFINGIPVVVIEAKRNKGPWHDTIRDGINQISIYENRSPDLFKYVQIGIAYGSGSERRGDGEEFIKARYFPTLPNVERENRSGRKTEIWRERTEGGYGREDIFQMLKPAVLLNIIRNYIYLSDDGKGKIERIVPRYVQYYASEEVFGRISRYILGEEDKNRGLIWHWQGSGKSYEIVYLAFRFLREFRDRRPHVFIVVDRRELEEQFDRRYISRMKEGEDFAYNRIESVRELRDELQRIREQSENPNLTYRSLNLVLLQKFREEELEALVREGGIDRKEILILRDEVHRTEHGKLADTLYSIFRRAIRIGYTGTPVMKQEKNTFETYAYPQEGELYLDRFFIEQSIRDGYTVPLAWREAVERDIILPDEEKVRILVDEILEGREVESDLPIRIADLLEAEKRIERASEYIAENIEEDTEGFAFKAFVVTQNRCSAVRFYRHLIDKLREKFGDEFDEEWVQVVMTGEGSLKDQQCQREIEEFIYLQEKKHRMGWDDLIDRWKEDFRNPEKNPRILIVSDMLLQGYDAPVLKVMYIYKLMNGHNLLQATARTNRPYSQRVEKLHGLIVDMTGMLVKRFKNAIREYNLYASREIQEDVLKNLFREVEERWREFKESFEGVVNLLNEILSDLKMDFEELYSRWGSMPVDTKKLIVNYITSSSRVIQVMDDLKKTIRSFESIGMHPEKVKYYGRIEFMKELLRAIRWAFFGPKARQMTDMEQLKEEVLSHLDYGEFESKAETLFDLENLARLMPQLDEISRERLRISGLISLEMRELRERKGPLYMELYERLEELRDRFIEEQKENIRELRLIEEELNRIKEERKRVDDLVNRYQPHEQLAIVVHRKFLSRHTGSREKEVLDILKKYARRIMDKNAFYVKDRDELEYELFDVLPDDMDPAEMDELVREISEYIEKHWREFLHEEGK